MTQLNCVHCGRPAADEHVLCLHIAAAASLYAGSREALEVAIREARSAGMPLRAIAAAADLSPEWVRRISLREPVA